MQNSIYLIDCSAEWVKIVPLWDRCSFIKRPNNVLLLAVFRVNQSGPQGTGAVMHPAMHHSSSGLQSLTQATTAAQAQQQQQQQTQPQPPSSAVPQPPAHPAAVRIYYYYTMVVKVLESNLFKGETLPASY